MLFLLPLLHPVMACGTLNAAHPLQAGEHRVGASFGGPFTPSLGPPIPVPNLIIEARSGLNPLGSMPLDVNYGLNLTAIAFGQMGVHGGASLHLLEGQGKRPSLSVTERLHLYNNYLDKTKPRETRMLWGANEFDITASWKLGGHHFYFGGSNILDLADPELLLSPFVGIDLHPEKKRVAFQIEARVLGANFSPEIWDISWLTLGGEPGYGLISVTVSASWALGKMDNE